MGDTTVTAHSRRTAHLNGQPQTDGIAACAKGWCPTGRLEPGCRCDLRDRRCGPSWETNKRRSETCDCVRGPTAPKTQCLLTIEFSLVSGKAQWGCRHDLDALPGHSSRPST